MSKIKFLEFNDKVYPLSFSLMAVKTITKKYGSLDKMEALITDGEVTTETIDAISFIASTLIHQGCAYMNLYESDVEPYKDAPYEGGKYMPVTADEIETILQFDEIEAFIESIYEAIGMREGPPDQQKNEGATQGM